MKDTNFDDTLALSPEELGKLARSKGWALSAVGSVVYAILRLFRQKPQTYEGICPYFAIGKRWGGLSLGWFFICGKNASNSTRAHEVGHIIQNAKVGGWQMVGLSIKSALRYWKRKLRKDTSPYDSWWFEGQASALGRQYVNRIKRERDGGETNE